eukprot:1920494-Rhodomonas_salina.1
MPADSDPADQLLYHSSKTWGVDAVGRPVTEADICQLTTHCTWSPALCDLFLQWWAQSLSLTLVSPLRPGLLQWTCLGCAQSGPLCLPTEYGNTVCPALLVSTLPCGFPSLSMMAP